MLAAGDYIRQKENLIALENSGTGKTHIRIALGMVACQKGESVLFTTATSLVHDLLEAQEEKKFLSIQKKLISYNLLIIDELGFFPSQ